VSDLGTVPEELVSAGAPADFSEWTEEQKSEFFKQAAVHEPATGDQDSVEVAEMDLGEADEATA